MENQTKGKSNLFQWAALAFEISFMLCLFAPIDLFFANADEYWFTFGQLMSVTVVAFVIAFLVISLCLWGLSKIKVFNYIYAVCTCGLLYLYVQGNYIPRNYGVLNGTDIDWAAYTGYGIASIVLAVVCIAICVVICIKFKDKIFDIGKWFSVFLFLIQIVTISTLMVQNSECLTRGSTESGTVNSDKGLYELSADNNIVVFVLDTYDGKDLTYLLENDYDKYSEIFEDFTFYKDTLGAYPTTKCSIPFMLTGKWYENSEPYSDYVKASYTDNPVYNNFEEKNFELNLYTESTFIAPDLIKIDNEEIGQYIISDKFAFFKEIYKLVAFNYMPHQVKHFFFTDTGRISNLKGTSTIGDAFSGDVQNFAERLNNEGLKISKKGNLFKFIHLDGTHLPYTFDENLISEENREYTSYDEAAGNATMIKQYTDYLKEAGVYDNTAIVLIADHGHFGYSQNPLFMVKNVNEHHEFEVSDTEMSFEFLDEIWIALANGESVDSGFIGSCVPEYGQRRFLYYTWDDAWSRKFMPGMEEMLCNGVASEPDNLEVTGRHYIAESADYSYTLGTFLEFYTERTGFNYCQYGIDTLGAKKKALLKFDLSGQSFENLKVTIHTADICGNGSVPIYANGQLVAELPYEALTDNSFIIPRNLIGEDNTLEIVFDTTFGDSDVKNALERTTLVIDTLVIESTSEEFDENKQFTAYSYELGYKLVPDNMNRYAIKGLSFSEGSHIWTNGNETDFRLRVNEDFHNIRWDMSYGTFNGEQPVEIYVNNTLIDEFTANSGETHSVIIPGKLIDDGMINIRMVLPNATAPCDVNPDSTDERLLAIDLLEMTFSNTDEDVLSDTDTDNTTNSEQVADDNNYDIGTELYFDRERPSARKYYSSGFSTEESYGSWTDSNKAVMLFELNNYSGSDLKLNMMYDTFNGSQNVTVYANGEKLEEFMAQGEETKEINIPASCIKDGALQLTFELPDAVSPKELGQSEDARTIALYFQSISIS